MRAAHAEFVVPVRHAFAGILLEVLSQSHSCLRLTASDCVEVPALPLGHELASIHPHLDATSGPGVHGLGVGRRQPLQVAAADVKCLRLMPFRGASPVRLAGVVCVHRTGDLDPLRVRTSASDGLIAIATVHLACGAVEFPAGG